MMVYMTGFCTKPIQDTLGQERTVLISGVLISRVENVLYHRTVNHIWIQWHVSILKECSQFRGLD